MNNQEEKKPKEEFISYEEARVEKEPQQAETVSDKEVEATNDLLSPDENTLDRG